MPKQLIKALGSRAIPYEENISTASLSTFRIGGTCRLAVRPQCLGDLAAAIELCRSVGVPYAVVGRCSNLLPSDGELQTVLILTAGLVGTAFDGACVTALCGTSLPLLCREAAARGLSGLAFAAGIPATVGGAVYMNAGANGSDIGAVLKGAWVYDPKTQTHTYRKAAELALSYRHSALQENGGIVTRAVFSLLTGDRCVAEAQMKAALLYRRQTQPSLPSAGSVFKRTDAGVSIAKYVDEMGLKGFRIGGAAISTQHAGFIVNTGGATAYEVRCLISYIKDRVKREKGIMPVCEIQCLT